MIHADDTRAARWQGERQEVCDPIDKQFSLSKKRTALIQTISLPAVQLAAIFHVSSDRVRLNYGQRKEP
jgi:hypothetical protein